MGDFRNHWRVIAKHSEWKGPLANQPNVDFNHSSMRVRQMFISRVPASDSSEASNSKVKNCPCLHAPGSDKKMMCPDAPGFQLKTQTPIPRVGVLKPGRQVVNIGKVPGYVRGL